MLILISPAKTLDFSPQEIVQEATKPELLAHSQKLIPPLRELSSKQLGKLMGISDKLSDQVHGFFQAWKKKYNPEGAKQAVLAFRGDVYLGLEAEHFSHQEFAFAQDHLRILSGLYGVLRPLDLIQPYRLEMGLDFSGDHGANLYDFWQDRIAKKLKKALAEQGDDILVNLASNEYSKAARTESFPCRVITPVFKDRKGDQYKVLSFFAKKARGMMAKYIIEKRIEDIAGLKKFRLAGYRYSREHSTDEQPTFLRDSQ